MFHAIHNAFNLVDGKSKFLIKKRKKIQVLEVGSLGFCICGISEKVVVMQLESIVLFRALK